MRLAIFLLLGCRFACAQETPLRELPYTPSLEMKFVDKTVDPCVDFYKYSCGQWNKINPIPADQSRWDVYGKMDDENARYLWGILEQASKAGVERSANEQKIGDYFGACMNLPAIDKASSQPIAAELARIAALKSVGDIAGYVAVEHRSGVNTNVLFRFSAEPDLDNSTQMLANASAGGLGLPDRDYYTKADAKSVEIRQHYLQHVAQNLELIGESPKKAKADAADVMAIETKLASASLTRVEQRDPHKLKNRFTREKLIAFTPQFHWDAYWTDSGVPGFKELNVTEPKFFAAVNDALGKNKLAQWKTYFRWHLVHAYARYLSPPFDKSYFEFYSSYLRGVKEQPPRWKTCTSLVDRHLGEALGQVFVERTFTPETRQATLQMVQQIEAEMGADIESLTWMSAATKKEALLKLRGILNKIGYPERWRDYSAVEIVPGDFPGDVQRAAAFEERRELTRIGKPVDRSEWDMTPPTVNAYYDPQTNQINFPAGVLLPPLYDPKMDAAPNYGNTAATIGHELTHGFDDEGRQFDATGNLRDWWTPDDAKAFEQRVSCVRDQYAQYVVVDDIHINSKLTLGEDVADLGGTLLAYLAWKHDTAHDNLQPVDGLTPDQRFFVGMAQWACGDERAEQKRMNATVDPHSPLEFRVNGVVSNMPEFGHAFGCKEGQPMMRAKACRVW
jgi:endothelin-converting enzyme/putative endopeptidase